MNWAGHNRDRVTYTWFLDDEEVAAGAVDIPAGSEAIVDLSWFWTFDRHELAFVLDSADAFAEEEERNNRQVLFTDAKTWHGVGPAFAKDVAASLCSLTIKSGKAETSVIPPSKGDRGV